MYYGVLTAHSTTSGSTLRGRKWSHHKVVTGLGDRVYDDSTIITNNGD